MYNYNIQHYIDYIISSAYVRYYISAIQYDNIVLCVHD